MSKNRVFFRILFSLMLACSANCFVLVQGRPWAALCAAIFFFVVNGLTGFTDPKIPSARLRWCNHGAESLVVCVISAIMSIPAQIVFISLFSSDFQTGLLSVLVCYFVHFVTFWNGIISVYCASVQLGIRLRVIGALCGMIPVANLIVLSKIIKIVLGEVRFETEKILLNRRRKGEEICRTRYPVLMVHGVFFRDYEKLNYWGRVPGQLAENGAEIFYGEHQSALSVEDSARELADRIMRIAEESGCGKLNVIAHSKGGLDCRYAIKHLDCARYIASLTTINTPHRGCGFAEYLLNRIAPTVQTKVAAAYNAAARKMGDSTPDFMAAVHSLTAHSCKELFEEMEVPEGIYCQSVGSVLVGAAGGKFPLNFSYPLVKYFDGPNDGLVSEQAFCWGEKYTLLTTRCRRGISHGDMIDLNRENLPDFDVREFYVQLVADLKQRGL